MIEVYWYDDDKRALYYKFPATWTWEDFYRIKPIADTMLDEVDAPVPLIFDLNDTINIPVGALSQTRNLMRLRHPNGKPLIMVSQQQLIRTMISMIYKINPGFKRILNIVASVEEAEAYIAQNLDDSAP